MSAGSVTREVELNRRQTSVDRLRSVAGSLRLRWAWASALLAGVFLLLAQKKVAKEKGTPGSAPGVARFLALLGRPGGLPELACGSDKASRLPPARLRCSAPLKGPGKPSGAEMVL